MTELHRQPAGVSDELRALGQNLLAVVRAAWASEGRRRVQADVETAVDDLMTTLGAAARDFTASEAGQRLEQELRSLGERVESGEVEAQVRLELEQALRRANAALARAAERLGESTADPATPEGDT